MKKIIFKFKKRSLIPYLDNQTGSMSQNKGNEPRTEVLPLEYGPDFISNTTMDSYDYGNHVVYLNESVYQHIDPYLTTNKGPFNINTDQYLQDMHPDEYTHDFETVIPFTKIVV